MASALIASVFATLSDRAQTRSVARAQRPRAADAEARVAHGARRASACSACRSWPRSRPNEMTFFGAFKTQPVGAFAVAAGLALTAIALAVLIQRVLFGTPEPRCARASRTPRWARPGTSACWRARCCGWASFRAARRSQAPTCRCSTPALINQYGRGHPRDRRAVHRGRRRHEKYATARSPRRWWSRGAVLLLLLGARFRATHAAPAARRASRGGRARPARGASAIELWAGADVGTYFGGGARAGPLRRCSPKPPGCSRPRSRSPWPTGAPRTRLSIGLAMPMLARVRRDGGRVGRRLVGRLGRPRARRRGGCRDARASAGLTLGLRLLLAGRGGQRADPDRARLRLCHGRHLRPARHPRRRLLGAAPTLPLALPVLLLLGALAFRAALAPSPAW